jgi:hypothetical protein
MQVRIPPQLLTRSFAYRPSTLQTSDLRILVIVPDQDLDVASLG